jgi:hypothetical protein
MRAERRERAPGRAGQRHLGSQGLGKPRPGARDASAALDELPGAPAAADCRRLFGGSARRHPAAPAGADAGVSSWNPTVRWRASPRVAHAYPRQAEPRRCA